MILSLPHPVSVNAMYANVAGKGRVKSGDYHAWAWQAKTALSRQRPLQRFTGPVSVTLYLGEEGVSGRKDADNCFKATLDFLKSENLIVDDGRKWVRRIAAEWIPGMAGMMVKVEPAAESMTAAMVVGTAAE